MPRSARLLAIAAALASAPLMADGVQLAESRIRDTDMANEMTFAAHSAPQAVLSLLRG